ncbi:hypothetical protein SLEP1_g13898 [Rubroshorea leprosula]|uniref:RING-type E3 ubiquitin transferase n=1 Tax=Rubroshorea leprosula TaxID=152421 RepID=A0AAV5IHB9_9ROSI|nr:hypothetical protein SLEP1_g13898 [Rubroshorea leprosula]
MEEAKSPDDHMTSAAAFVEGGIQDACDDACSICLEEFSESDPSTLTNCKHEFHLQCILEWCQRSSQCPMCWQHISLKEPTSQELLEAVERERRFRAIPSRNAMIFHHPTLGAFELQHLPVGANDSDLEERIIQHLAAAAAMGRSRHTGRREGHRTRSSAHGHPHLLAFPTHPNAAHPGSASSLLTHSGGETELAGMAAVSPSAPLSSGGTESLQQGLQLPSGPINHNHSSASGSSASQLPRQGFPLNNRSTSSNSFLSNQERAGSSDFQSFSESLKSRFNAVSTRYKESISKSTRGWRERLFSRTSSMSDLGSEVRREVNAGMASVSRMMEHPETRGNNRASDGAPVLGESSVTEENNQQNTETHGESALNSCNIQASCAAGSVSS